MLAPWRAIWRAGQETDIICLFTDLAADPYQLRNLAGTAEQAEVAAELDRRLRAWDARTPWMTEP